MTIKYLPQIFNDLKWELENIYSIDTNSIVTEIEFLNRYIKQTNLVRQIDIHHYRDYRRDIDIKSYQMPDKLISKVIHTFNNLVLVYNNKVSYIHPA